MDALGEGLRDLLGALEVGEQQHELVAAVARDQIALAQVAPQARRQLAQHDVARRVPEPVVDVLEAVEVDEQHGDAAAVVAGAGDGGVERLLEQAPVGEPGQVVVMRVVQGAALALDPQGDVGERDHRAGDRAAGVADRPGLHLDPRRNAVGPHEGDRLLGDLLPVERACHRPLGRGEQPAVRVAHARQRLAGELSLERAGRDAADLVGRGVRVAHHALGVDDHHALLQALHDEPQQIWRRIRHRSRKTYRRGWY